MADLLSCINTTRFLPGTGKWWSGSEKATDMDNTFGVRRRRISCSVKWNPSTSYAKTLGETKPAISKITGSLSIRSLRMYWNMKTWVFFNYYISEEPLLQLSDYSGIILMIKEEPLLRNPPHHLLLLWTSLRTDTCSCWCSPQACSKADKILRHTPSDILQICCLGCCTAVPNAAASWTLRMASWEAGNAFHFSS